MVIHPEPAAVLDELSLLGVFAEAEESGALTKEYPQAGETHWKSPKLMVFPE